MREADRVTETQAGEGRRHRETETQTGGRRETRKKERAEDEERGWIHVGD